MTLYKVNKNGETYGHSGRNAILLGTEPDLISAYGIDGTLGYVRATELDSRVPKTPEEAVVITLENSIERTINLYESDGETVIGTFKISPNNN